MAAPSTVPSALEIAAAPPDTTYVILSAKPEPLKGGVEQFRCVPRGTGGTFPMDRNNRRIGVKRCKTSVGVYFEIDDKRSFCAHIKFDKPYATLTESQAKRLQREVFEKLKQVCKREKWPIENECFGGMMTVMCEQTSVDGKGGNQNGPCWYIMLGLQDFIEDVVRKLTPKAMDMLFKTWKAMGLDDPKKHHSIPPNATCEQQRKAKDLKAHLECLILFASRRTTEKVEGQAFIIDWLSEAGSRRLRLRKEDGRAENVNYGDVDLCQWVEVPVQAEENEWSFTLSKA